MGMSVRGQVRRDALVEAAAQLLAAEGPAAVTHRATARRAGLPLGATTYYFASGEELLCAATELLGARRLALARQAATTVPADAVAGTGTPGEDGAQREDRDNAVPVARAVVAALTVSLAGEGDLIAGYERYLQTARTPSLAASVRAWNDELAALVAELVGPLDPVESDLPRLVMATADGATVTALAEGVDDPTGPATAAVAALLALRRPVRRPTPRSAPDR